MLLGLSSKRRAFFLKVIITVLIGLDVFASFHSISFLLCEDCQASDPVQVGGEVIGIIVVLFCNVLAMKAIKTKQSSYLIPWLVVYLIAIITCYVGSLLLLAINLITGVWNFEWILPLCAGVVFNIIWVLAKSTYDDMKRGVNESDTELHRIILK